MASMGWIGFDLDGTLASDEPGKPHDNTIGEPIPSMVELVKAYLKSGYEVRIVTARGSDEAALPFVKAWVKKHIGQDLVITDRKDYQMILLYDDRAIAVERNTGRLAGFRM